MANHLFGGCGGGNTLQSRIDLRGGVTQFLQGGMCQCGGIAGLDRGCGRTCGEGQLCAASAYLILQLYGCTGTPNEGVKWNPDRIFREIHRIETEHRWLKDKTIFGVADPSIWDASRGESVAESASKHKIYFTPGDNKRIAGWMQVHYRLAFDENGYPMMYIFNNCKAFIRTVPALQYDDHKVEDLDTEGEDHCADEVRYFCMSRPIKARTPAKPDTFYKNPLHMYLDIEKSDLAKRSPRPRIEILTEE